MAIGELLGGLSVIGNLAIKVLERTDPKLVRWAKNIKALNWSEKYIFLSEDIFQMIGTMDPKNKLAKKKLKSKIRKLKWLKKQFFANN